MCSKNGGGVHPGVGGGTSFHVFALGGERISKYFKERIWLNINMDKDVKLGCF